MPMVVAQLKTDLKSDLQEIFADLDPEATAESKAEAIANALADRIDAYIRTATVSVTTIVGPTAIGLQMTTNPGSPTGPPAVPVPLDGTGSLS
jgi:hypothetical protein